MSDHTPQIIPIPNGNVKDISGQRFGRLVVLSFVGTTSDRKAKWLCQCDCGNRSVHTGKRLRTSHTQSCGCLRQEVAARKNTTHGMTHTTEYTIWAGILDRCYRKNNEAYPRYGGRGITVCDRWRESFENFYTDMGERPAREYSIDRINNDLGYSPDNCRWATGIEQCNNTRRNHILEFGGERLTVTQWARKLGIQRSTLNDRVQRGWPVEIILTTPVKTR